MSKKEKILDDIGQIAGDFVGTISNARSVAKDNVQARIDEIALRLDLVPRHEFERLEILVQSLSEKVGALEAQNQNKKAK